MYLKHLCANTVMQKPVLQDKKLKILIMWILTGGLEPVGGPGCSAASPERRLK